MADAAIYFGSCCFAAAAAATTAAVTAAAKRAATATIYCYSTFLCAAAAAKINAAANPIKHCGNIGIPLPRKNTVHKLKTHRQKQTVDF